MVPSRAGGQPLVKAGPQDAPSSRRKVAPGSSELSHHRNHTHQVTVDQGGHPRGVDAGASVEVSCYHQCIATLGVGLVVTARSEEGVVEALELPDHDGLFLGVQWHAQEHLVQRAQAAPRRRRAGGGRPPLSAARQSASRPAIQSAASLGACWARIVPEWWLGHQRVVSVTPRAR